MQTSYQKKIGKSFLLFLLMLPLWVSAKEYRCTPLETSQLKLLLNGGLAPGDTLILEDGIYNNLGDIHFSGTGKPNNPIVWQAEHPGKAIISGVLNLKIYGEHLQREGLCLNKAWPEGHELISFQQKNGGPYASNCRMTNCVVDDCNNPAHGNRPGQGDEYLKSEANDTYLIIDISITNHETEALTVSDSFFKLLNNGNEYSTDDNGAIYLGDSSIIYQEINPEVTLQGRLIFDVPETIANDMKTELQVQTGVWGSEKDVISLAR